MGNSVDLTDGSNFSVDGIVIPPWHVEQREGEVSDRFGKERNRDGYTIFSLMSNWLCKDRLDNRIAFVLSNQTTQDMSLVNSSFDKTV